MDQSPAPQPETLEPPYEAWRQFTLLDLMILFTGHGAAMGFLKWYGWLNLDDIWLQDSTGIFIHFCLFIFLGAVFSIPPVYAIQYLFRKRQGKISGRETFTVCITVYWIAAFIVVLIFPKGCPWKSFLLFGSIIALLFIPLQNMKVKKTHECPWLCIYGIVIWCISFLFLTFLLLLNQIS
jgi:hypothetical protein